MHGRETRGMRANNKNKHPRSEAREHMGLRIHVSSDRRVLNDAADERA